LPRVSALPQVEGEERQNEFRSGQTAFNCSRKGLGWRDVFEIEELALRKIRSIERMNRAGEDRTPRQ